ncbi:MAG: hypothetical protein ACQKBV_02825, partial [Puniceicoccales bacterium]
MRFILGGLLMVLAMLLGAAGWFAPVYLDAVAPVVLREAGLKGSTPEQVAGQLLDEGKFGPAWRINAALQLLASNQDAQPEIVPSEAALLNERIADFIASHPGDRMTGSAEAYGQQFIKLAPKQPELAPGDGPV